MADNLMTGKVQTVNLADIDAADTTTQTRKGGTKAAVVQDYAEKLDMGVVFPPIVLAQIKTKDGDVLIPIDGRHRIGAHMEKGRETIEAYVHAMTEKEAVIAALSTNDDHGLPRTNADKKKAITMCLALPGMGKKSNTAIAKLCAVSVPTVAGVRAELEASGVIERETERETADGRTMKTGNIGGKSSGRPSGDEDNDEDYDDEETDDDGGTTVLLDGYQQEVPDHAREYYTTYVPQLRDALALLKKAKDTFRNVVKMANEVGDDDTAEYKATLLLREQGKDFVKDLNAIYTALNREVVAQVVCPYCLGHDAICPACDGGGMVSIDVYKDAPDDIRENPGTARQDGHWLRVDAERKAQEKLDAEKVAEKEVERAAKQAAKEAKKNGALSPDEAAGVDAASEALAKRAKKAKRNGSAANGVEQESPDVEAQEDAVDMF